MPGVLTPLSMHAGAACPLEVSVAGALDGAAGAAAGAGCACPAAAATVNTNARSFGWPSSPETLCQTTEYWPGPASRRAMLALVRCARSMLAVPLAALEPLGPVTVI